MDNKSIVTIEDLKSIRPISDGVPVERINPYITEAHFHDLRPALGDAFYHDFMGKFDDAAADEFEVYNELIAGKEYEDGGHTLFYPGLKFLVAYFTLARFYSGQPVNVTKFNLVQKTSDQSTPLDPRIIAAEVAELRSMGVAHQALAKKFLSAAVNVATYPLYTTADTTKIIQTGGIKFF